MNNLKKAIEYRYFPIGVRVAFCYCPKSSVIEVQGIVVDHDSLGVTELVEIAEGPDAGKTLRIWSLALRQIGDPAETNPQFFPKLDNPPTGWPTTPGTPVWISIKGLMHYGTVIHKQSDSHLLISIDSGSCKGDVWRVYERDIDYSPHPTNYPVLPLSIGGYENLSL